MPDLTPIVEYIQQQAGNVLMIILVIKAVIYIKEEDWVTAVIFVVGAGACWFTIANPEALMNAIEQIWNVIVP